MKKMMRVALLLAALALTLWAGASPALAYYAPLQDVTGPTVAQGTDTTVTVSVHNPATGQDIPHTWTIPGGASLIAIDQTVKNQGMVAWRVKDLTNNKYKMVWGVYDPGWAALQGRPQDGWMFNETWTWIDNNTYIVDLADGVFVFETKYTTTAGQTNIIDCFEAYDPSGWYEEFHHGWMPFGWREYTYSFINWSGGTTRNHMVKDGVVAWIYDNPGSGREVIYAVYDGRTHWWSNDQTSATLPSAPQITNATVTWTDDGVAKKCGYDYTTTSWVSGADTKVMAYFDFWPTPAKPGQWVYFTDMSIAATNWYYSKGDGDNTGARSFYHKYAKPGQFQVMQNVLGPAGSDAYTQTVPVKLPGSTGPLMLLLN